MRQSIKDISKFSQYNNLYTYTAAIQQYERLQNLSRRQYDDIKMNIMFLQHLDDDCYEKAVESTQQKVKFFERGTLPLLYRLPGIATMVSQHSRHKNLSKQEDSTTLTDTADTLQDDRIYATRALTRKPTTSTTRRRTDTQMTNNTQVYTGDCHACRCPNHHAHDCFFLQKI